MCIAFRYDLFFNLERNSGSKNNSCIQQNKKKTQELEEEKSDLEETKQKLTNPDYIEYIARGKYLVTKEGEQVFKFPSSEDEESEE